MMKDIGRLHCEIGNACLMTKLHNVIYINWYIMEITCLFNYYWLTEFDNVKQRLGPLMMYSTSTVQV